MAIVDYKTDSWKHRADLDAKVAHYQGQMRSYARAVREWVGREVSSATLQFPRRDHVASKSVEM